MCNCNKILVEVEACAKFSQVRVCKIGEKVTLTKIIKLLF